MNTQKNANEIPKESSSLIFNEKIENTPFHITGINEKYFITFAHYRLTTDHDTIIEALQSLEDNKWNIIMYLIGIIIDIKEKEQKRTTSL